jgi:hypothetical protein
MLGRCRFAAKGGASVFICGCGRFARRAHMADVGVALLGCGFIAEIHADCYRRFVRDAKVEAVVGRNEEKVKAFAERFGIPRWFTDYRKALELKEVQLADVCMPNFLHAQLTVDAAAAGKHVICEKPLCMNLQEADQMIEACRRAGVRRMKLRKVTIFLIFVIVLSLLVSCTNLKNNNTATTTKSATTTTKGGTTTTTKGGTTTTNKGGATTTNTQGSSTTGGGSTTSKGGSSTSGGGAATTANPGGAATNNGAGTGSGSNATTGVIK